MIKTPKLKDVDSYIANSDRETRQILEELRKIIKTTIPNVEEKINWGFPFYKYNGTYAHFAAYKHHIALGFGSDLLNKDREILEKNGYATGQKRIQIKFDQKVPATEIKQILKTQAKMNETKRG
jgi:uncharacterized protein YdhG (YjbR/CyaY superfamily)